MELSNQKCCICREETGFVVNINFKPKFVCDECQGLITKQFTNFLVNKRFEEEELKWQEK